jgi:hypothetical protein
VKWLIIGSDYFCDGSKEASGFMNTGNISHRQHYNSVFVMNTCFGHPCINKHKIQESKNKLQTKTKQQHAFRQESAATE